MKGKRSKEVVSYNMSRIRSKGTNIEIKLEEMLQSFQYEYISHPQLFGKPDYAYPQFKIAIFADSDFWHGFDWEKKKQGLKTNRDFWINKIERNMERDKKVTKTLEAKGWKVIRLWGHDILKNPEKCHIILQKSLGLI